MDLTVDLTALSGSNFLILRTFLFMTHYAQTAPWGILVHPKNAIFGLFFAI